MVADAEKEKMIGALFCAELQFRLASAVGIATTFGNQPLDLPTLWSHGRHVIKYEEIALRPDQADYAAYFLQRSSTLLMATVIRNAIVSVVSDPKISEDVNIVNAYQIARMIRNAFAHDPISPKWSIDKDCRDKTFEIDGIIKLQTNDLNGINFDWRHYGGPLAILRLSQYVRYEILGDERRDRKPFPYPKNTIYQQGNLILKKIDSLPEDADPP